MLEILYGLINGLIEGVAVAGSAILAILPSSPFSLANLDLPSWFFDSIAAVNFFVPVDFFLTVGSLYLACVPVYYIVQWGLRWIKTVD